MEIRKYRELNKHETYPITKKQLKLALSSIQKATAIYGLNRKFEYDSRQPDKPKINGVVIASVSCYRDRTISLYLFPIDKTNYTGEAKCDFVELVLPRVKTWMEQQIAKPETAVLGVEEMIIEWDGKKHLFHHSKYL